MTNATYGPCFIRYYCIWTRRNITTVKPIVTTTVTPIVTTTQIPENDGKNRGLIAGLVIAGAILLTFVIWLVWRKIKANNSQGESNSLRIEDFDFRNEAEAEAALGAAYWPDPPRHIYIKK